MHSTSRRELQAAKLTLDAADELLKPETKTIDGERFWDRFARVSEERIAQADAARRRDSGR